MIYTAAPQSGQFSGTWINSDNIIAADWLRISHELYSRFVAGVRNGLRFRLELGLDFNSLYLIFTESKRKLLPN